MQLTEHIDLQERLASLRGLLERRMGMELAGYEYWLQGVQQVSVHRGPGHGGKSQLFGS